MSERDEDVEREPSEAGGPAGTTVGGSSTERTSEELFRRALEIFKNIELEAEPSFLLCTVPRRFRKSFYPEAQTPHEEAPAIFRAAAGRTHRVTESDDERARGEARAMLEEINETIRRMQRTQEDIDRLKEETRAILARIDAA